MSQRLNYESPHGNKIRRSRTQKTLQILLSHTQTQKSRAAKAQGQPGKNDAGRIRQKTCEERKEEKRANIHGVDALTGNRQSGPLDRPKLDLTYS